MEHAPSWSVTREDDKVALVLDGVTTWMPRLMAAMIGRALNRAAEDEGSESRPANDPD